MHKTTKHGCEKLVKKVENDANCIFEIFPTLKSVITEIESDLDESGEAIYQNQKLNFYSREKTFLKNNCLEIVSNTLRCFQERYESTYTENSDKTTSDGNHLLFVVYLTLVYGQTPVRIKVKVSDLVFNYPLFNDCMINFVP